MNICIIGAGITGLTIGRLLSKSHSIKIFEKKNSIGGIARTKEVDGNAYHTVGGHCLNSKNKDIMNFVFNEVLPKKNWHKVKRNAKIYFHDHLISYPIEFSIKEIAKFNEQLAFNITKDFMSCRNNEAKNLEDWFKENFGQTLAEEYFIPYNRKIWQTDPSLMDYSWVKGKLPLPNKKEFFKGIIGDNKDTMPHSSFYYPNANNQNVFIEALGKGLNVCLDFEVSNIEKKESKWVVNGKHKFDMVINTMPLNILPFIIKGTPSEILTEAKKLKYNKVTNMFWKTKPVEATWTYLPSPNTIFHRHIHIGNFFSPKKNVTITECNGEHSYEDLLEDGRKYDYLIEPLDYNVSDHAYVVYDHNYKGSTSKIKQYLEILGLHSIGRFGEWEYYNMDVCMESAFNLVKRINKVSADG